MLREPLKFHAISLIHLWWTSNWFIMQILIIRSLKLHPSIFYPGLPKWFYATHDEAMWKNDLDTICPWPTYSMFTTPHWLGSEFVNLLYTLTGLFVKLSNLNCTWQGDLFILSSLCTCYFVIFLNWTSMLDCCVIRQWSKNKHHKETF